MEDIDRVHNETSVKDWLIVAHVRNEPDFLGFGTDRNQYFYQWKGKFYKICFRANNKGKRLESQTGPPSPNY